MPDDAIERAARKALADAFKRHSWGHARAESFLVPKFTTSDDQIILEAMIAFASQQAPGGWMPIETAPKDGTYVMLYDDGTMRLGSYLSTGWEPAEIPIYVDEVGNRIVGRELAMLRPGCSLGLSGFVYEPTHWRPLPAPPAMLDAAPSAEANMTPMDHLRAATNRATKYSGDDGVVVYIMLAPKGPLIVASKGPHRADRYVPWDTIGPDIVGLVDGVRRDLMLQMQSG